MDNIEGTGFVGFRATAQDRAHLVGLARSTGLSSSQVMRIALRMLDRETLIKALHAGTLASEPGQAQTQQEPAA